MDGEPTASYNIGSAIRLCREFKKAYPFKNVWLWSGRTFEEIKQLPCGEELLSCIDFLVDGRFVEALKDISLKWRGSSNQRLWRKLDDGSFIQIDD